MEVVTNASSSARDPQTWSAAQDLHKALFTELFKSAGFAEAFSTGDQALDALSHHVLESIAEEVSSHDQSLAEVFYRQLSGGER